MSERPVITPAMRERWAREIKVEAAKVRAATFRPDGPTHGTRSRYCAGCRCHDCRVASRLYEQARRLAGKS